MPTKKIVFLGSKPVGFECLSYLISQRAQLDLEIIGLLTQARKEFGSGHDLTALAAKHGIPLLDSLESLPECDIIYSVQYHQILKQRHIDKARGIAVNLHMAPLPEYRGSNQFSFAIIEGKAEFGTTIHQIDTRIDHGAILFQKRFAIPAGCWVSHLYQLTYNASVQLFQESLGQIVDGSYSPVPQQSLVPKYGASLHMRHEMDALKEIDLGWDKEKVERHIRATSMPGFEPPFCVVDGIKVHFVVGG